MTSLLSCNFVSSCMDMYDPVISLLCMDMYDQFAMYEPSISFFSL
jgi:hypothetical protein